MIVEEKHAIHVQFFRQEKSWPRSIALLPEPPKTEVEQRAMGQKLAVGQRTESISGGPSAMIVKTFFLM